MMPIQGLSSVPNSGMNPVGPQTQASSVVSGFRLAAGKPDSKGPGAGIVKDVAGAFDTWQTSWTRIREKLGALEAEEARLRQQQVKPGSMKDTSFQNKRMAVLLEVQMEAQQIAFGVQVASKLIEHASTGLRTTLQTQA